MKFNRDFKRLVAILLLCGWLLPAGVLGQQPGEGLPQNGFDVPSAQVEAAKPEAPSEQIVASKRLLDVIKGGGPLMIPIAICSFILVVFAFERFISLRKGRILPGPFTRKFLQQLDEGALNRELAMELCDDNGSPVARVFKAGVEKWGRPSVEVEQAILDEGERQSNYLRRYLRLINCVATITPLLGLLGTVLGMIHAFDAISSVDSNLVDPKVMIATGISQALLTTAAGMSVAIPALIAYMFFSSRVDQRVTEIDSMGMKVVRVISAESKKQNSKTGSRSAA
ncbi:MAG: MotA/TolQ/ExbB proton channel family protein [Mariniblastus sp.]|nr:MotA/TolQ/ExbB proton channel family protein [Mariniblastus sp.]